MSLCLRMKIQTFSQNLNANIPECLPWCWARAKVCCDERVDGVGDNDVDDDDDTGHEENNEADLGMRRKERMGDAFDPNLVFEPLGDFQSRSLVLPHSLVNSDNEKLFHEILAKSVVSGSERVIFMMAE